MKRPVANTTAALLPKSNQKRQGSRGSSSPHAWNPNYSAKRIRAGRHFRDLEQERLKDLFDLDGEQALD
eukprot:12117361-Karenia_brevis.AAC.1